MTYLTRTAELKDISSITAIYNQAIEDKSAAFEAEFITDDERKEWLLSRDKKYSVIIIENESGEICGWASLNKFDSKCCFSGVADLSIYIKREMRNKGLGKILLSSLIDTAKEQGFSKLVLNAIDTNNAGKGLYLSIGFREVGIYKDHAIQDNKWIDVVIMEKLLSEKLYCNCGSNSSLNKQ